MCDVTCVSVCVCVCVCVCVFVCVCVWIYDIFQRMIVPLNSWYHRVSLPNKLITYTEMVLYSEVSTHNMSEFVGDN